MKPDYETIMQEFNKMLEDLEKLEKHFSEKQEWSMAARFRGGIIAVEELEKRIQRR